MCKKKSFITLLVIMLFSFWGCEKEQSELDMGTLKERATISGYIVYNAGVDTTTSTDYVTDRFLPVAKQTVFVEIPYSEFKPTSQGNYIIETTTDSLGHYSVEVPTKSAGIAAVVRMQEFTMFKSVYEEMVSGKPVFKTDLYRYVYTQNITSLKPGTIEFLEEGDVKCIDSKVNQDSLKLTHRITLSGRLELAYETGFRQGAYQAAANAMVEFEIEYPHIVGKKFAFTTMSDAQGNYQITLPLESYEDGFKAVSVKVKGQGATYAHYGAIGSSKNISGAYTLKNVVTLANLADIIEGMEYKMPTIYLKFSPGYNNTITTPNKPSTWKDNLAGWERYNGFVETKTITGKYLLAEETAFGMGAYANKVQEAYIQITYPGTDARGAAKTVVVNAATDGTYSFEVPVKDANEALTITPQAPVVKTILHYLSDGKGVKLNGTFGLATTNPIREVTAEWNEVGESYYNFTATAPDAKLMWNADLAAWKKPKAQEDDKLAMVEIKANIWQAVETALAVGEYTKLSGMVATITVGADKYSFPVVDGTISGQVFLSSPDSEPVITFNIEKEVTDFVHFNMDGKTEKLAGEYTNDGSDAAYWTGEDKADRESWGNLSDIYCQFTPKTAPDFWATYFKFIAGWQRRVDAELLENVAGSLYRAVETGYYYGDYISVKKMLTKITVAGVAYVGITDDKGKYAIPVLVKDPETPAVVVTPSFASETIEYDAYTAPGIKETKDVEYALDFSAGRIDGYTSWKDRGSAYYKVASGYTPKNLLGWANRKSALMNDANERLNLHGAILKAEIDSEGTKGTWVDDYESRGAEVTINGTKYYTSISGKKYVVEYNVKDIPETLTFAISVEGGSAKNKQAFTYYYKDGSDVKSTIVYGYYSSGALSSSSINRDGTTNNYYITPKSSIDQNDNTNKKVLLKFGVTDPSDPTSLTNWGTYSSYLDNK